MPSAIAPSRSLCRARRLRSARQLQDRLDPALREKIRRHQARQVHLRTRAVGDVHRARQALERRGACDELRPVGRDRRADFRGDDEIAAQEPLLQQARRSLPESYVHFGGRFSMKAFMPNLPFPSRFDRRDGFRLLAQDEIVDLPGRRIGKLAE